MIDGVTYHVVRIQNGMAFMHNVNHYKGRPRQMLATKVPYFDESGVLITPKDEATQIPPRKYVSKVNIKEIIKENTDLQVSKKAVMFIHEQLEFICEYLIINANETALKHNHTRIGPEHVCHMQVPVLHTEVCKDHKEYIEDGM